MPYWLVYSVVLRALVAVGWERGQLFNAGVPIPSLFVPRRVSDLMSKRRR